jgi:hypothetical protein
MRFSFGIASTGDGFAAKSSFIQIGRKDYRNFASRPICIDLEGTRPEPLYLDLVCPFCELCLMSGLRSGAEPTCCES